MAGFGLRIARSMGMEGFTGNTFEYPIDPANTNLIFSGDPVILNGGFLEEASGNIPGNITPSAPIMGSFAGCRYVAANGDYRFERFWDGSAGNTEVLGQVSMPPHSRYYVKGAAATNFQPTDVGNRFELFYNAGAPAYGDSRVSLGQAAPTTGVAQLHGLAPLPGNQWGSDEPILEISIVLQQGSAADSV